MYIVGNPYTVYWTLHRVLVCFWTRTEATGSIFKHFIIYSAKYCVSDMQFNVRTSVFLLIIWIWWLPFGRYMCVWWHSAVSHTSISIIFKGWYIFYFIFFIFSWTISLYTISKLTPYTKIFPTITTCQALFQFFEGKNVQRPSGEVD